MTAATNARDPDPDDLLNTEATSELLGIPVPTLKWWRLNNRGPRSFRLSDQRGRIVYRRSDITSWVDAMEQASGAGGI